MRLPKLWGIMVFLACFVVGEFLTGRAIDAAADGEGVFLVGTPFLVPAFIFLFGWIWELQKRLQGLEEELERLKEG